MQIENTSLLSMQNTYMTKGTVVSSQSNQTSAESERSSSMPDAGPAAVFGKGCATNGMTETVGISRVASMGSAGMLYSAGIMPTENNTDHTTESSNGINIKDVAELVNNKQGGSMTGSKWSAVINPENVRDGSVISVNGIKFEFDADDNTQVGADVVTVDIKGLSDSAVIFQKFVDTVNANENAKRIAKSIYGDDLPDSAELTGLCSWNKVNNNWTLQFTQSPSWAREGDTFKIETGKFVNDAFIGSIQPDADAAKININNLVDGANMSLTTGAETKTFTVQTMTAPPSTEDIDIISEDTIKLYKPTDISSSTGD